MRSSSRCQPTTDASMSTPMSLLARLVISAVLICGRGRCAGGGAAALGGAGDAAASGCAAFAGGWGADSLVCARAQTTPTNSTAQTTCSMTRTDEITDEIMTQPLKRLSTMAAP